MRSATLADVRRNLGVPQSNITNKLGVHPNNVSAAEKSRDPRLSTILDYIEALGGTVSLIVKLPGTSDCALRMPNEIDLASRRPGNPRFVKAA